jgi:predicted nucleic acid-binding protein
VIVVLDANVLYPPSLRDLLLTLAALDAFEPRWSEEILDEVTRNVLEHHPDIDPSRFTEHTIGSMRRAFPEAVVAPPVELIERLDNDPKDRHVAAAALTASAQSIITLNLVDFESKVLRDAGVDIVVPGEFVDEILRGFPEVVLMAVTHIADRWTKPSRTPEEIVDLLATHPSMAAPMETLRSRLADSAGPD